MAPPAGGTSRDPDDPAAEPLDQFRHFCPHVASGRYNEGLRDRAGRDNDIVIRFQHSDARVSLGLA